MGKYGQASAPAAKRYVMRKKEEQMKTAARPSTVLTSRTKKPKQAASSSPQPAYCCFRFRESVKVDKTILKATRYDETEWYLPQGGHIYFCPFCGHRVKGKGFGTYKLAALTVEEMRALKRGKASEAATAIGQRQEKRTRNA